VDRRLSKGQGFTPWAPHHWLWGVIIQAIGFYAIFRLDWPLWVAVSLTTVGLGITLDDVYQHIRQRYQPWYHSPVHRAYWVVLNWAIDRLPDCWLRRFLEWAKTV